MDVQAAVLNGIKTDKAEVILLFLVAMTLPPGYSLSQEAQQ